MVTTAPGGGDGYYLCATYGETEAQRDELLCLRSQSFKDWGVLNFLSLTPEPGGAHPFPSTQCWLKPWAVWREKQEEVSPDSRSPWLPDRLEGECVAHQGWGNQIGQGACGWVWKGGSLSPAMPTLSRKHFCWSDWAVGGGQLCGTPADTSRRWLLRAEGKQSPWLLGRAPGVMGQPWNIPGSEGGRRKALASESEWARRELEDQGACSHSGGP